MNYVVWDIETDSAQTDWATIIEIGGILLDENFKELVLRDGHVQNTHILCVTFFILK